MVDSLINIVHWMADAIWNIFIVGALLYAARKLLGEWLIGIIKRSDRRTTIWNHYVKPDGHNGEVLDCQNQTCLEKL
jgi:hypothetical protein